MTLAVDPSNTLTLAQAALQARAQTQTQTQTTPTSGGAAQSTTAASTLTLKRAGSNVSAYAAVSDGLSRAVSISDTAQAGAGSVLQILQQLKQLAGSATSGDLASSARSSLSSDFQNLVGQLSQTVKGASASGVNLIDGSAKPGVPVVADADGGQANLTAHDLRPGGATVTVAANSSVDTASAATTTLSQVQSSLQGAGGVLSDLVTQAKQIGAHADFVGKLGGVSTTGGGGWIPTTASGCRRCSSARTCRPSPAASPMRRLSRCCHYSAPRPDRVIRPAFAPPRRRRFPHSAAVPPPPALRRRPRHRR